MLRPRAWHRVEWRNGTRAPWTADFAALRVTAATDWRRRRLAPEIWLLCERGLGPTGRRRHYFVSLPASASLQQLVRLAHHRWAIEQHYQDFKSHRSHDDRGRHREPHDREARPRLAAHRRVTVPVLRLETRAGQNETAFSAVDMATFFITLRRQRTSFRYPAVRPPGMSVAQHVQMAATSRRLRDGVLSAGCIGTIVAAMAAIDETIRGSLVGLFQGGLPNAAFVNDLSMSMLRAQHVVRMFSNSVGLSGGNDVVLMGFGLGTIVLFVLMLRS